VATGARHFTTLHEYMGIIEPTQWGFADHGPKGIEATPSVSPLECIHPPTSGLRAAGATEPQPAEVRRHQGAAAGGGGAGGAHGPHRPGHHPPLHLGSHLRGGGRPGGQVHGQGAVAWPEAGILGGLLRLRANVTLAWGCIALMASLCRPTQSDCGGDYDAGMTKYV
jgi:hypothetical protein